MTTEKASAEAEQNITQNTGTSLLLSVKQDYSRLASELTENSSPSRSVTSAVSECEESVEAVSEVSGAASKPLDVAGETTEAVEHAEDEPQPDESPDATTNRLESRTDDCYVSPSSQSERGLRPNMLYRPSSTHCDDGVQSPELSDTTSKKALLKRESAKHTRLTPFVVKKLRRETEISPSQLLRTSSGNFVVSEVTETGEKLQPDSRMSLSIVRSKTCFNKLTCQISHM